MFKLSIRAQRTRLWVNPWKGVDYIVRERARTRARARERKGVMRRGDKRLSFLLISFRTSHMLRNWSGRARSRARVGSRARL
jgi:hypothetical protein